MSEDLKGWIQTITDLIGCRDKNEILESLREILLDVFEADLITEGNYLDLCREITYILIPNIADVV